MKIYNILLVGVLSLGLMGSVCAEENTVIISNDLNIHIPLATYKPIVGAEQNLWVDLNFSGSDVDGNFIWKLGNYGINTDSLAMNETGFSGFAISRTGVDIGSDYNKVCSNEFGSDWQVADWTDIESYHLQGKNLDDLVRGTGLIEAWIMFEGAKSQSEDWDYFISYHNHQKPNDYFEYDDIDDSFFSLGAWFNIHPVLCKKTVTTQP